MLLVLALPVGAAGGERERIAAERRAIDARHAQEERACAQRFAVTDCVAEVRARRRAALAPLRERELALDDAERRQRAADRREAIAAKQREQAARPPAPPEPELRLRRRPAAAASAPVDAAASAPAVTPKRTGADDSRARAAQAAERAGAAQRRREAGEVRHERVQRRLAERAAAGKKAVPLPTPAASAAAR